MIHLVFNISSLRLAASDPLLSQIQDSQEPKLIIIDGEDEFMVKAIINKHLYRHKKQYLVK